MSSRSLGALTACLIALALPASAWADGFQYMVKNQKSQTDGPGPVLVLQAEDIFKGGKVVVSQGGKTITTSKFGKMNPGAIKEIPLKVGEGSYTFQVQIEATTVTDAKIEVPLEFKVVRAAPITIGIDRDNVDVNVGELSFMVNRPLDRIEMAIYDKSGNIVDNHTQNFNGRSGQLKLHWPARAEMGALEIKAYDVDEFWVSLMLEPFFIEIPHEEIIFDFGKATWQASEEPKLERTLKAIQEAMVKYERFRPDMRLYIAGYTDSVGSPADNQRLSQERAEAIARWFKKRGVKFPLFAQGFGESVLLVKTADETPEERNRRAIYVLSNARPAQSNNFPRSEWRRVQ
jgi:outer membrane protein OmpA-like peptidoglycan-associated protein